MSPKSVAYTMPTMVAAYVVSLACDAAGNCVEAGLLPTGDVAIRDTKDRDKEPHVFSPEEWDAFVAGVKAGQFDRDALPAPTPVAC